MTKTEIPITELHMMARQMKMGDFINWFAKKYMNIPLSTVKPDIYLTLASHPSEVKETERSCQTCYSREFHVFDEPCKSCDKKILSNWKPQIQEP